MGGQRARPPSLYIGHRVVLVIGHAVMAGLSLAKKNSSPLDLSWWQIPLFSHEAND